MPAFKRKHSKNENIIIESNSKYIFKFTNITYLPAL